MSLNPFLDLEGIILTHGEMEQDMDVCHQKSFTTVNICFWQQNSLNICQSQEESGNTTQKVVIGDGRSWKRSMKGGRMVNELLLGLSKQLQEYKFFKS